MEDETFQGKDYTKISFADCAHAMVGMLDHSMVTSGMTAKMSSSTVKEADAVVLGTPVHHNTISAIMTAFISRSWGFRHVNFAIKDKPLVLAICGIERWDDRAEEDFRRALQWSKVNIVDVVRYSSTIPPCYRCGRHQECFIGGAYRLWDEKAHSLTITPELFIKWEDDPETVAKTEAAAEKLS